MTQSGTHNGELSNVVEIERLIIQKQLAMNQSAILLQQSFFNTFFLQPVGSDLSGGHWETFFLFTLLTTINEWRCLE